MGEDLKTKAKIDYLKGLKLEDIAQKYDTKINTLKSWIKRYGWADEKKDVQKKLNKITSKKSAPQSKKGCTLKSKGVHSKLKKGAPFGNQNSAGHGAPSKNQNARKHGLFSKYLPTELNDIVEELQERSPVDMLVDQIHILYANIVAAQKKIYVKDINDMTKELKREKRMDGEKSSSWEEEYNLQFAWEKQNAALNSMSRSMTTFNQMIKNFMELDRYGLVDEETRARISKLNAEISKITDIEEDIAENDGFINALKGKVDEIWQE